MSLAAAVELTRARRRVRTAETHRANLMHKLSLHSQTDVVRYALNRGILSAESRTHPPPR